MFLPDSEIIKLIKNDTIKITPYNPKNIGPSSIDLTLSSHLASYDSSSLIKLGHDTAKLNHFEIDEVEGYILKPQEFILGSTIEHIVLPNGYQGFIETRGNSARAGLQAHNADGHIDPGTNHHITLEISNQNNIPIVLYPNIRICQLYISKMSALSNKPYNGKYLGQKKPTGYMPDIEEERSDS